MNSEYFFLDYETMPYLIFRYETYHSVIETLLNSIGGEIFDRGNMSLSINSPGFMIIISAFLVSFATTVYFQKRRHHTTTHPSLSPLGSYEAILHNSNRTGRPMLGIFGYAKFKIHSDIAITKDILLDSLRRTVLAHYRLACCYHEDGLHTFRAAQTIGELELDAVFSFLTKEAEEKHVLNIAERQFNTTLPRAGLGWRILFLIEPQQGSDASPFTRIHCICNISHILSDGFGSVAFTRTFVQELNKTICENRTPVSLDTPIIAEAPPTLESRIRINLFTKLWKELTFGTWFALQPTRIGAGAGFIKPRALDHSEILKKDAAEGYRKASGFRLVRVSSETIALIRKRSRRLGGSVTAAFIAASLAAYRTASSKIDHMSSGSPPDIGLYQSFHFAANMRAFMNPSVPFSTMGNYFWSFHKVHYRFRDGDKFWDHVTAIKRFINSQLWAAKEIIRATNFFPVWLNVFINKTHPVYRERDHSTFISNMGILQDDEIKWASNIEVEDLYGSSNQYFNGVRAVFGLTCTTVKGQTNIVITYPVDMVAEDVADAFVESFESCLRISAKKSDLSVLDVRSVTS